ncbi:MAG: isoprenylcysteine carboxylmethyltransferase family protein [Acidobacteriota bacterium]|nr:isoprenylcysteine carboxylmethyltransferase family protein [Acidobacteriota bacterium]
MNPWFGNAVFLTGILVLMIIRGPHGRRSGKVKIVESRKGRLELALLAMMWIATMILPLIAIATPLLSFAEYRLEPAAFSGGVLCLAAGLWLFYRSHADLGVNWSISLELREDHRVVTSGVYRRVRHPMYTAIFLQAIAQALLLSNWVAGPACLLAFLVMFSLRLRPEEDMMMERFGDDYGLYIRRTKRLIPGVW